MVVKKITWVPAHRRAELRALATRSQQVVMLAAVVGAATGLVVALFDRLVVDESFDSVLMLSPWLIGVMPGIGLLVAYAIRRYIGGGVTPSSADEYLRAFHDRNHLLGGRQFIARMLAAVATLGSGGPMGLEGPSMYAGSFIGSTLQRRLPRVFRGADRRVLLVAGAAAGVAAIFKAPATGAVFALEVPYQDDLARRMLLPALVAAASGYLVFVAINGTDPLFPIDGAVGFALHDLLGAVAIGIVGGIAARGFAWLLRRAKAVQAGRHPLRITIAAGVAVAAFFALGRLLTGDNLVVGAGYNVMAWASEPGRTVWILLGLLVLRSFATAAVVAGGGVGGLFVPLVVAGALVGAAIGSVVDAEAMTLFIVIGVAAFLGAGYRVPLASVMFVAETTGRPSFVVPGLLAAVAAELVMGRSSVTNYQWDAETAAANATIAAATPNRS
ncbi:MAG: chloride channel protein, partial [Ilumatobacteraceae bacterium]